jgi:hypothetical protein
MRRMTAYEPDAWHDLFVMAGGAAAALAGLIFVAVSLNDKSILEAPALAALAGRTFVVLIGIVLACGAGLAPGQSRSALGIELLALGGATAAALVISTVRHLRSSTQLGWKVELLAMAVAAAVPGPVAGVSMITGAGGGLYWLLGSIAAGFVAAAYWAWTLLVEIRR